jgi:uncharacterized protein
VHNCCMKIHYLEIVTTDVDAVCTAYASLTAERFSQPDPGLGNARTAALLGGGFIGVRSPMHAMEQPVTRPYWLVQDIEATVEAVVRASGTIVVAPLKIPGRGTCAIYFQGGVEHGLWQV